MNLSLSLVHQRSQHILLCWIWRSCLNLTGRSKFLWINRGKGTSLLPHIDIVRNSNFSCKLSVTVKICVTIVDPVLPRHVKHAGWHVTAASFESTSVWEMSHNEYFLWQNSPAASYWKWRAVSIADQRFAGTDPADFYNRHPGRRSPTGALHQTSATAA